MLVGKILFLVLNGGGIELDISFNGCVDGQEVVDRDEEDV